MRLGAKEPQRCSVRLRFARSRWWRDRQAAERTGEGMRRADDGWGASAAARGWLTYGVSR